MDFLWKCSTYLVLIPLGCMKLVQTSDLFIKLFKDVVNKLVTGNMQEHLQDDLARSQLTKLKRQAWKDRGEIKYMAITGIGRNSQGEFSIIRGSAGMPPRNILDVRPSEIVFH